MIAHQITGGWATSPIGPGLLSAADRVNQAVDLDGAIDLQGAIRIPSMVAVLLLVVVCVVGAVLVVLLLERRESRRALASQAEELQRLRDEIAQQTSELQVADLQVHSADRSKSQFLASMSHELRTPLNSINGFSGVLLKRLEGKVGARELGFLRNIQSAGVQLERMIDDLLDLANLEVGRVELRRDRVDPADLLHGLAALHRGRAREHGVELEIDIDADLEPIVGDEARIKQSVHHLLLNAVKFSPEGGTVTARARRAGDDQLAFEVVDHGIGISEEKQELIFDGFAQADAGAGRRYEGAGLGLALVRRFSELHGGRAEVESAPGQGSTFRIVLPRTPRSEAGHDTTEGDGS